MSMFEAESTTMNSSQSNMFNHDSTQSTMHSLNNNSLQIPGKSDWCSWLGDFLPRFSYTHIKKDANSTQDRDIMNSLLNAIWESLFNNQHTGEMSHSGSFSIDESLKGSEQVDDFFKSIINDTFSPKGLNSSLMSNDGDVEVNACISFQSNFSLKVSYMALSFIFSFIALIGNLTILLLSFFEKSFRSPVFITLQSLSVVSIVQIAELLLSNWFYCPEEHQLFNCTFMSILHWYCQHIINLHLSLLACQRIFMTVAPLKALIYHTKKYVRCILVLIYFACAVFEVMMAFLGQRACKDESDVLGLVKSRIDFVLINIITIALLVSAMIISAIQKYTTKNLQSVGQKRQSRLASVVIVLFLSIYMPVIFVNPFLKSSCQQESFTIILQLTDNILRLSFLSIIPIILCLRTKVVRTKLTQIFLCKCSVKD